MTDQARAGYKSVASRIVTPLLAALFAIGGYLYFNSVGTANNHLPEGKGEFVTVVALISVIVMLTVYLTSLRRRIYSITEWGCSIQKVFWIILGVLTSLIIINALASPQSNANVPVSTDYLLIMSNCIIIFLLELILRGLVITYLLGIFGKSRSGIFSAVLISGILFALVMSPVYPIASKSTAAAIIISWTYYASGTIYPCLFFDALRGVPDSYMWETLIIITALYFVFAVPGYIIGKRASVSAQ